MYSASERGLVRREGVAELMLLEGPVVLEFWDGVAWRAQPEGAISALRVACDGGREAVVLR
jgi:hypothetical protein